MSRNLLIAALTLGSAAASAQVVNTQVNGLTFTNGLSSITDSSALGTRANVGTGVSYLTDNDVSTFAINIRAFTGTTYLQGNFNGATSSLATGVYIVSLASAEYGSFGVATGPSFAVQLVLLSGLSSAISYGPSDFTITSQLINPYSAYEVIGGSVVTNANPAVDTFPFLPWYYAYLPINFSDFSVSPDQVLGIRLSNTSAPYPDFSFIGAGYVGSPVPEPSTYGLILGGLALAGAAIRRRKSAK